MRWAKGWRDGTTRGRGARRNIASSRAKGAGPSSTDARVVAALGDQMPGCKAWKVKHNWEHAEAKTKWAGPGWAGAVRNTSRRYVVDSVHLLYNHPCHPPAGDFGSGATLGARTHRSWCDPRRQHRTSLAVSWRAGAEELITQA